LSPRFAFFYLMKNEPERVRVAVPRHVSHWRELRLTGYLGGPFEDRTGGLITFETHDRGQAEHFVDIPIRRGRADRCLLAQGMGTRG
jgi:hypothetical protein